MQEEKKKKSGAAIEKARSKTYNSRKECIKKKAKELSTLCDIKACMLCFGPDGIWETWPENPNEVDRLIKSYRKYHEDRDGISNKKKKGLINWESKKKNKSMDEVLLREVDLKMEAVTSRIELLKMIRGQNQNQISGMGMGFGTIQEEINGINQGSASFYEEDDDALLQEEIDVMNLAGFCLPLEAWPESQLW